jgi:hypothetical protein
MPLFFISGADEAKKSEVISPAPVSFYLMSENTGTDFAYFDNSKIRMQFIHNGF